MSQRGKQLVTTGLSTAVVITHTPTTHVRGGRDLPVPVPTNKTVQVRATDNPATDRYIFLRTVWRAPTYIYRVGVVDGFNRFVEPPKDYPTLDKARNAANRKHNHMAAQTKEP